MALQAPGLPWGVSAEGLPPSRLGAHHHGREALVM